MNDIVGMNAAINRIKCNKDGFICRLYDVKWRINIINKLRRWPVKASRQRKIAKN